MDYVKICVFCGKPYTSTNKLSKYCYSQCVKNNKLKRKETAKKVKVRLEIDKIMEKEFYDTEPAITNCYKCGKQLEK